jgi:hypothetical protein
MTFVDTASLITKETNMNHTNTASCCGDAKCALVPPRHAFLILIRVQATPQNFRASIQFPFMKPWQYTWAPININHDHLIIVSKIYEHLFQAASLNTSFIHSHLLKLMGTTWGHMSGVVRFYGIWGDYSKWPPLIGITYFTYITFIYSVSFHAVQEYKIC